MKKNVHQVTVLGGGSFGTVIANMIAANGYCVNLWLRDQSVAVNIANCGENTTYLPGHKLHKNVVVTTDLKAAVEGCKSLFFAVPSSVFRELAKNLYQWLDADVQIISTAKGIEVGTFLLPTQILRQELPNTAVGLISGPNLAREIAERQITATVVAHSDDAFCKHVQKLLVSPYFRVYTNHDQFGVELAGALKNIYAIMAGIVAAKGLGENTGAMLLTRSLAEMGRFAQHQGANPLTFLGLAGVGDLIATCSSPLSRNYRVGFAFGSGKTLEEAVEELGEVAEGVNTLAQVKRFADENDIYMPLVQGLYQMIYNKVPLSLVIEKLMSSEQNTDVEFTLSKEDV